MKINKVVVIGSGTMGSGISAHLSNANISVTLLDLKTEIAEEAKQKILNFSLEGRDFSPFFFFILSLS